MLTYRIATPLIVSAAAGLGIIAQTPASELGGDYTKYGVIGILAIVIMALLHHTIPKILDNHTQNATRIADELKSGMGEVRESIDKGNDRVATLLQSTLAQAFRERRDKE